MTAAKPLLTGCLPDPAHGPDAQLASEQQEDQSVDSGSSDESRHVPRSSLFIMADLRMEGENFEHRVKMRNLSAGGLMAEGTVQAMRGMVVWIKLREIGWTEGTVAWVQANRFGVAFREEINPDQVRVASSTTGEMSDSVVIRRNVAVSAARSAGQLRKL
ncbi:MAG: PilZ domain-containing protein [Novosphingobium sp.]